MRQKLTELRGEIGKPTTIVGESTIPLSIIGRTSSQKASKDIDNTKNTINQLDPTDT